MRWAPAALAWLALLPGCGPEAPAAAAPPGAAAPAEPSAAAVAAAAPVDVLPGVDPALAERLEARVRSVVEGYVRRAADRTGGKVGPGNVTVSVCARAVGEVGNRVAIAPDAALVPASNMKLLTTAAALVVLGPEGCFETRFEAGAPLRNGVLEGDLIVRAGADPLYDPEGGGEVVHLLAPVVAELRAQGLLRVRGDIVLDEGSFQPPGPGPGWPDPGQHWKDYCALSAGFTANGGCLTATVTPRAVGQMAAVDVQPASHGLPTDLRVRTQAGGKLNVAVEAIRGKVVVRGSFPVNVSSWSTTFAHPDPVGLFGSCLGAAFRAGGIGVDGHRRQARGVVPGQLLAVLRRPVVDTLVPINTHSVNAVADQLFLAIGLAARGEGTRVASAAAVREALEELGVDPAGLVQVDGSGLSRENRVRAEQLVALLEAVLRGDPASADAFLSSLAVAGETGTLEDRMGAIAGRVRAKTGWIAGASALSGFASTDGGETIAFSILVHYPNVGGLNTSCWKPMQDGICKVLVEEGS